MKQSSACAKLEAECIVVDNPLTIATKRNRKKCIQFSFLAEHYSPVYALLLHIQNISAK
jgi:hypothetical protein